MAAKSITIQPSNSLPSSQQGIKTLPDSDTAFLMISFVIFSTIAALIYTYTSKQKQHFSGFKLPPKTLCHRCQYFSNNSYLKCALHPETALTEQAVDCRDYCPNSQTKSVEEF